MHYFLSLVGPDEEYGGTIGYIDANSLEEACAKFNIEIEPDTGCPNLYFTIPPDFTVWIDLRDNNPFTHGVYGNPPEICSSEEMIRAISEELRSIESERKKYFE